MDSQFNVTIRKHFFTACILMLLCTFVPSFTFAQSQNNGLNTGLNQVTTPSSSFFDFTSNLSFEKIISPFKNSFNFVVDKTANFIQPIFTISVSNVDNSGTTKNGTNNQQSSKAVEPKTNQKNLFNSTSSSLTVTKNYLLQIGAGLEQGSSSNVNNGSQETSSKSYFATLQKDTADIAKAVASSNNVTAQNSSNSNAVIKNILTRVSNLEATPRVVQIINTYPQNNIVSNGGGISVEAFNALSTSVSRALDSFNRNTVTPSIASAVNNFNTNVIGDVFSTSTTRGVFSNTATGLTYDNSTGVTSLTSGYVIPLTASTTEWASTVASIASLNASTTNLSNFYQTPSTRITAGTGLAWSGNTINSTGVTSIGGFTGAVATSSFSTSDFIEGSNLYFTNGRADARANIQIGLATSTIQAMTANSVATSTIRNMFSNTVTGLTFNSGTGITSLTSGYNIPLTASTTEWANKVSSQWTTSGANISYVSGNVGIGTTGPQGKLDVAGQTLIGNGDRTAQSSYPLYISDSSNLGWKVADGSGISKFELYAGFGGTNEMRLLNGVSLIGYGQNLTLGTSQNGSAITILDNASGNVGIGTTTPETKLSVVGAANFTGNVTASAFYGDGSNLTGITSFSTTTTRNVFSNTVTGLTYSTSTGITSLTSGYNIPLTASTTEWANKVSSQWLTSGADISYAGGNIGIGTTTPVAVLSVQGSTTNPTVPLFTIASSTTAQLFTVAANGNVGIASSTPSSKLTVAGDINFTGALRANGDAGTTGMVLLSNGASAPTWVATSTLGISGGGGSLTGTTGQFAYFSGTNTAVGTSTLFLSNGNIGIGTTTPASALSVVGAGNFTSDLTTRGVLNILGTGTSTVNSDILLSGDIVPSADNTYRLGTPSRMWKDVYIGPGSLYVNGQKVLQTDVSNNVTITADSNQNLVLKSAGTGDLELNPSGTGQILLKGNLRLSAGKTITTSDASPLVLTNGADLGSIRVTSNTISPTNLNGGITIAATGTGGVYFTQGNVGIATTSPAYPLTVSGDINFTGALRANGNPGTTGMVLLSNGSSAPTWVATSSLGIGSSQWTTSGSDISFATGYVGIGTTTPSARLFITGSAGTTDLFNIASSTNASLFKIGATGATYFNNDAGTTGMVLLSNGVGSSPTWVATSSLGISGGSSLTGTTGQFAFFSGTNTAVGTSTLFLSNGNIGIGTTTPPATFTVAGGGLAAESIVLGYSNANIITPSVGFSGYTNFAGGIGTGGRDSVTPAYRLTSAGNLVNIGSIQAGELSLTNAGAFAAKADYTTGSSAYTVAIGDLNGDGKADLAAVNSSGSKLSIFINNGSGTFATKVDYTVGSTAQGVTIGDVNGDGKPDIAVTNGGSATVSILLNVGSGTFGAKTDYTTGTSPYPVVLTDVNGDGKSDLIVGNSGANTVSVLMNNGNGTFATKVDYAVGSAPSLAVGDFNGDGKTDIVTTGFSFTASVLMNNGNGTFATKVDYATGAYPASVAVGDITGDGKDDFVTGYQGGVSVYRNNGAGTFATQVDYSYTNGVGEFVSLGDLNGDGKLDVVSANYDNSNMSVLLNTGSGVLGARTNYTTGANPRFSAIGDLNSDGKADIVTANAGGSSVSVFLNTTTSSLFVSGSTGFSGIGTTTPSQKLSVAGNLQLTGAIFDSSNASGTVGMVLQSTGTGTQWVATSSLGISGGGGSLSGGTNGYLARWTSASTLSSGLLIDNGTVSGVNATSSSYTFNVQGSAATNPFNVASSSGVSLFTVLANGNVGIGTTTPGSSLVVQGSGAFTGKMTLLDTVSSSVGGIYFGSNQFLHNYGTRNTFTGSASGNFTLTGTDNTGNGINALGALTSGHSNAALGSNAGNGITSGVRNVAIGYYAIGGGGGSTGNDNVAIGYGVGSATSVTGAGNVGLGMYAIRTLSSGNYNVALGYGAGEAAGTAANNVFVGKAAGSLTTGSNNIMIGYQAGANLVTGTKNIIIGYDISATSSTMTNGLNIGNLIFGTGLDGSATTLSTGKIGIGSTTPYAKLTVAGEAYADLFTAGSTTATSTFAGGLNVGNGALTYNWATGLTNIANASLGAMTFDSDSGMVSWVDMPVTSASASGTVQSYTAQLDGNPMLSIYGLSDGAGAVNTLRVGVGTTTPVSTFAVAGTINASNLVGGASLSADASGNIILTPSDERLKQDIKPIESALDKLMKLQGVTFDWKDKERFGSSTEIGFIAQDVQKIVPEVIRQGPEYMSLNYSNMVALVVEAVKELKTRVDAVLGWFSPSGDRINIKGMVCVDDVCVTKDQFKQMLMNSGSVMVIPQTSAPAPTTSTTPDTSGPTEDLNTSSSTGDSSIPTSDATTLSDVPPVPETTPTTESVPVSEPAPTPTTDSTSTDTPLVESAPTTDSPAQ